MVNERLRRYFAPYPGMLAGTGHPPAVPVPIGVGTGVIAAQPRARVRPRERTTALPRVPLALVPVVVPLVHHRVVAPVAAAELHGLERRCSRAGQRRDRRRC